MINHKPKSVMTQVMRGARVDPKIISGVRFFRCPDCAEASTPSSVSPVKAPSMYSFNHEVVADVFYNHDMAGTCYGWLSMLCNGTTFHAAAMVCVGKGTPQSAKCWSKLQSHWAQWAGYPTYFVTGIQGWPH